MKREYARPAFIAEEYTFNTSVAECARQIKPEDPITIKKGENVCGGGLDGHVMGGQNGNKGEISQLPDTTLFNDGTDNDGCKLDWDYKNNIILQTGKSFAETFYGNDANVGSHAPGYLGQAFLS